MAPPVTESQNKIHVLSFNVIQIICFLASNSFSAKTIDKIMLNLPANALWDH